MRQKNSKRWRGGPVRWALCLLLAATVSGGHRSLAEEGVVVIVHSTNDVSSLSVHDLRLMYGLFRRVWQQGTRVQIVLPLPGTKSMDFLIEHVYLRHKSPIDVERFYRSALFEQRIGSVPVSLGSRETLAFVGESPGALAVIDRSMLPADPHVKVIEIDSAELSAVLKFPSIAWAPQARPPPLSLASGRWIRKIEPPFSGLSTWMFPEWARAISIARGRPNPSDELGWPLPR